MQFLSWPYVHSLPRALKTPDSYSHEPHRSPPWALKVEDREAYWQMHCSPFPSLPKPIPFNTSCLNFQLALWQRLRSRSAWPRADKSEPCSLSRETQESGTGQCEWDSSKGENWLPAHKSLRMPGKCPWLGLKKEHNKIEKTFESQTLILLDLHCGYFKDNKETLQSREWNQQEGKRKLSISIHLLQRTQVQGCQIHNGSCCLTRWKRIWREHVKFPF